VALIKSIDTEFGIPATYWNIGAVHEDFKGKGTEVTFYGYASQEARFAGKQPLSAGKFQIVGDEYVAGADRAALYSIIKQKPEFADAEDALEPTPVTLPAQPEVESVIDAPEQVILPTEPEVDVVEGAVDA